MSPPKPEVPKVAFRIPRYHNNPPFCLQEPSPMHDSVTVELRHGDWRLRSATSLQVLFGQILSRKAAGSMQHICFHDKLTQMWNTTHLSISFSRETRGFHIIFYVFPNVNTPNAICSILPSHAFACLCNKVSTTQATIQQPWPPATPATLFLTTQVKRAIRSSWTLGQPHFSGDLLVIS